MTEVKPQTRKQDRHLRVPVLPEEEAAIKQKAAETGLSVAAYLRNVGMGYPVTGIVDCQQVRELARINGDLGRLGGLLKLWLSNDSRTAQFGESTIRALLAKIENKQHELGKVMLQIVMPKSRK
jgi:hypothetical protein